MKDYLQARLDKLRGRIQDDPTPEPPPNLVELCRDFSSEVTRVLRELLTTKHLYQRIKISLESLTGENRDAPEFLAIVELSWEPLHIGAHWAPEEAIQELHFEVPHVKLYCGTCESIEAFNPVGDGSPVYGTMWRLRADALTDDVTTQTFAFPYLCQSCKRVPEVLLVRREGLTLTLCGRSPMEAVPVPADIPKPVRRFYSGAVVAYQSGQVLAGNFMLRTLIEQFARSVCHVQPEARADEVLDQYMATLPSDFKDRFRSMKELYGKLSADIHGGIGEAALFENSQRDIIEHFQARRLFKIP